MPLGCEVLAALGAFCGVTPVSPETVGAGGGAGAGAGVAILGAELARHIVVQEICLLPIEDRGKVVYD